MKKGRNKYASSARGELMLVHECVDCGAVSINRIAGDDDPDSIVEIFHASIDGDHDYEEIVMLKAEDREEVLIQLYGHLRSPFLLA